jgi:hypothetical protein
MSFVSSTRCTRRLASGSAPRAATQCGRSRPSFCERARPSALGLTPRRRGQTAGSLRDRPGRRQPPRQHMPQEELRARPCSCPQRHRGGSSPGPSHSSSSLRRSMPQQKWPQRLEGSRRHRSSSSTLHSMPQRERARSSWPKELWPRSLPHGRRPYLPAHSCGGRSLLPLPNAGTQEWARPLPKKPSLRRRCRTHLDEQRGLCRR